MHSTQDQTTSRGRFATFARETRASSPLYAHLSDALAADDEVAAIIEVAPLAQRRATLVFAAVHDLLLRGVEQGALAAYYSSIGGDRPPDAAATTAFLDVLDRHRAAIADRLRTRSTQTNEPGRTSGLCAALSWLQTRTHPGPGGGDARRLALVEVGTSAGLLLHLDRYTHRFVTGPGGTTHRSAASSDPEDGSSPPVLIETRCLGQVPDTRLAPVDRRIGIDRTPMRVGDPDDRAWLRACVWPEHVDRLARLDAALELAAAHDDLEVHRGDLLELLEPVVAAIAADLQVVVLHSATLAYLAPEDRRRFDAILDRIGRRRPLWRVGLEGHFLEPFATLVARQLGPPDAEQPGFVIAASAWVDGRRHDTALGRMQSHGDWLRFAPPTR